MSNITVRTGAPYMSSAQLQSELHPRAANGLPAAAHLSVYGAPKITLFFIAITNIVAQKRAKSQGQIWECLDQAAGRREAPKALRAFGRPRAQLCWALGHKENKIYFLWPRGRGRLQLLKKSVIKSGALPQICPFILSKAYFSSLETCAWLIPISDATSI